MPFQFILDSSIADNHELHVSTVKLKLLLDFELCIPVCHNNTVHFALPNRSRCALKFRCCKNNGFIATNYSSISKMRFVTLL